MVATEHCSTRESLTSIIINISLRISLVVQLLRICLTMQGGKGSTPSQGTKNYHDM